MADDESLKDEMNALLRAAREREPVAVQAPSPPAAAEPSADEPQGLGARLRKLLR